MRGNVSTPATIRQRGFSLVELGIVTAVISVLVVTVLMARGFRDSALVSNTVRQLIDIQKAAYQYSYRYNQGLNYVDISNAELLAGGTATHNKNNPLYDRPLETAWNHQAITIVVDPDDNTYFRITIPVPDITIKTDLLASLKGIGEDLSPDDSATVVIKLRGRPEGM
jgi:prepilin-type N-terminal cleavage/methylation domain-containing protein